MILHLAGQNKNGDGVSLISLMTNYRKCQVGALVPLNFRKIANGI
jgi:hypothetical protein